MSELVGNPEDRFSHNEAEMLFYLQCHMYIFDVFDQVRHKPGCAIKKMARGFNFLIWQVEGLYYQCSENKGADQLRSIFVFAYACWYSHDAVQIIECQNKSF